MDNFSIYNLEIPTKEDLKVTFTPDGNIVKYNYRIYKDDELISSIRINENRSIDILFDSTGKYQIIVEATDNVNVFEYKSGIYYVDKDAPEIKVASTSLTMRSKDKLNVIKGVKAKDVIDGELTKEITSNIKELNLKEIGKKELIYTVKDKAGNTTSKTVTINVVKDNTPIVAIGQIVIILMLLIIIKKVAMYLHSIILEKRYGKYAIESDNITNVSLFDALKLFYISLIKLLGEVLGKSYIVRKYSKHYDKYLLLNNNDITSVEIVATKIISAFAFLIITLVIKIVQYKTLSLYEIIIPLVFGFFVVDIIYIFKYKIYRDKIENDLLQAVIIMNNAFKSGRSIVQAIDLVGNELPGIIGNQFKIMKKEMSKGLSVEVVFDRFASRIDVEEVNYLTASLTILNKTGGNIIKVFTSIENSLFMKKKLRLEMNSLTSSSKVIMWVLFLVPILYVLLISLLNPSYFDSFFNTSIGIVLSTVAVIFYVIYIIIVRKILKVRM